ncbi:MAG: hypothetical protein ACYDA6_06310, partial [Solirubrobacteraceae bacterium]
ALAAIFLTHLFLILSPPLALTDVFNYLNYARMEVVHHLNPYVTIPVLEPHTDPAYSLSNWHGLLSPYGPLFTIFTFAFAKLTLAAYLWTFKAVLLAADVAILVLTWKCARLLGRDPLGAVVVVGLNPIVLVWGLGADHNDFLTMVFVLLGLYWMLASARRNAHGGAARDAVGAGAASVGEVRPPALPAACGEVSAHGASPTGLIAARVMASRARSWAAASPLDVAAGVSFVVAAGFKASAGVVVAVALASLARQPLRLRSMFTGVVLAAVPLAVATLAAFGLHFPNITVQGALVIALSIPNMLGLALGQGGETATLHTLLTLALVCSIAAACVLAWRRREALAGAGWATLAIIVTLSWVLPWYVLWVLPFAALSGSRRLRRATLLLGAYLIFAWLPITTQTLNSVGFHPQTTAVGRQHDRAVKELLTP